MLPSILFLIACNPQTTKEKAIENFSGTVDVNGTKLFCQVMGQGEPMVIIHGGPGLDHSYFLPHFNELAKDHTLIFYDQRASGQSDLNVDTTSVTLDNFVEDLEALRKHFKLEKMNLLGHSFGGFIAMKYAIKYPENLKSLMLIDSNPPTADSFQQASLLDASNITKEDSIEFSEIISSEEMANRETSAIEKLMNLTFRRQFYNRTYADSLNLGITDRFMKTSQLLGTLNRDLIDFDLTSALGNVTCPTLVIYGDKDPFYLVSDDLIYKSIPNAQNWVIQDCGHFPFIEKKKEFLNLVESFLSSLEH